MLLPRPRTLRYSVYIVHKHGRNSFYGYWGYPWDYDTPQIPSIYCTPFLLSEQSYRTAQRVYGSSGWIYKETVGTII